MSVGAANRTTLLGGLRAPRQCNVDRARASVACSVCRGGWLAAAAGGWGCSLDGAPGGAGVSGRLCKCPGGLSRPVRLVQRAGSSSSYGSPHGVCPRSPALPFRLEGVFGDASFEHGGECVEDLSPALGGVAFDEQAGALRWLAGLPRSRSWARARLSSMSTMASQISLTCLGDSPATPC